MGQYNDGRVPSYLPGGNAALVVDHDPIVQQKGWSLISDCYLLESSSWVLPSPFSVCFGKQEHVWEDHATHQNNQAVSGACLRTPFRRGQLAKPF